ncbi:wsc domain-containing protein [Apiospora saccharicola]
MAPSGLFTWAIALVLSSCLLHGVDGLASTDTITWGGDNSRTGYQDNHNMDPDIVGSAQFGKLFQTALPGNYMNLGPEQTFSQPLVYTLSATQKQYVYILTTQNNLYQLDAKTGVIVNSRNLHIPFLTSDLDGCVDINPTVGVTGTGVIDPATETLYFTAKTYKQGYTKGRLNGEYWFHAVDVNTLKERAGFPVSMEGTIFRNNPNRMFISGNQHQRPGLLQAGKYIYAGFASHCVQYNFTGAILGWNKDTGALVEAFAMEGGPEPNTVPGGGVWMSGGGLAYDSGSMYFATGNGYASQLKGTPVQGRNPPTALEEAAVNAKINDDGTITPIDFFMPWEKTDLDGADKDLGTSPLQLLPSSTFSCPNAKRIGMVTGKSGKTYWLNLDNLGGYQMGPGQYDAVPQQFLNENSVYAGAGVMPLDGGYVYVNVIKYKTHVWKFGCDANGNVAFTHVTDTAESNSYILGVGHGTTTSLNGKSGSGLLWVSDVEGLNLRIYQAVPQAGTMNMINSFNIPGSMKFGRPVFGDGICYVASNQGYIYGFGSPVNLPLNCTAPSSFGTVNLGDHSASQTVTSTFAPNQVGPLSSSAIVNTTNGVTGFSTNTPAKLTGTGNSKAPLLLISPNTVSFTGVITGQMAAGVNQTAVLQNLGNSTLNISNLLFSVTGETGPWITPNTTSSNNTSIGPYTLYNLPTTIAPQTSAYIPVNFNPTTSGSFKVFMQVNSNGGNGVLDMIGTSSTLPKVMIEFQSPDGQSWVNYTSGVNFSFGNVLEGTTVTRKMRLTNIGGPNAAALSVTVSKPPYGVQGIVGAVNNVDLAEGTLLQAGQSATADLYCSVPRSQVNVDSYNGTAQWTLNTGDPVLGKQFIQFFCNAASEQFGPVASNGSAIYRYTGCAQDNNPGRQLPKQIYVDNVNNTNGNCINACYEAGYTIAGTEYNSECWCGNTMPSLFVADAQCSYRCTGTVNQTCGGDGQFHQGGSFMSVFATTQALPNAVPAGGPAQPKTIGNYTFAGCYSEAANGRALTGSSQAVDTLTLESCAAFCNGFTYFGAEYGRECYCGNSLNAGSTMTGISQTDCSMTCAANSTELCGAGGRLSMYTYNPGGNQTAPATTTTTKPVATTSPTSTPTAPAGPSVVQQAGTFAYSRCVTEATNGRALSGLSYYNDTLTVEMCASICAGYPMMGVEYGRECYCGTATNVGSVNASESDCRMLCPGNKSEYCGSGNRLNLYTQAPVSTSTAVTSTTSTSSSASASVTTTATSSSATLSATLSTTGSASSGTMGVPATASQSASAVSSSASLTSTSSNVLSTSSSASSTASSSASISSSSAISSSSSLSASSAVSSPVLISSSASPSTSSSVSSIGSTSSASASSTPASSTASNSLTSTATSTSVPNATTPSTSSAVATTTSSTTPAPPSSTVITSSTTTSSGPSVPTVSGYAYQGCYTEASGRRALPDKVFAYDSMTLESCAANCTNYAWFGTEYGRECYCGATLDSSSSKTSGSTIHGACGKPCGGNNTEICGDGGLLSLFYSSDPTKYSGPPAIVSGNANYTYYGCVGEPQNGRALSASYGNSSMTVPQCLTWAASKGYKYAGLEYSQECWGGNTLSSGATNKTNTTCSMFCGGNQRTYCGGPSLLSLYITNSTSGSGGTGS